MRKALQTAGRSSVNVLVIAALMLLAGAGQTAATGRQPLVFTQEAVAADTVPTSRIAALRPDGTVLVLTRGMAAASDPSVSADGTRLLFAGKQRSQDGWAIWEMASDGSDRHRLTELPGDCREPQYLATAAVNPPTFDLRVPWITFTSTGAGTLDELGRGPAASLYAMSMAPVPGHGTVLWRTTYGPGGVHSPTVLADGRIAFASRVRGSAKLLTITWAGDNLNLLTGTVDPAGPVERADACELPDRSLVLIEADGDDPGQGGQLVRISLARPLHSRQVLAADGSYRSPHPDGNGGLLVAFRDQAASFGLYRLDLTTGRRVECLLDDPAWHEVDAMPISPNDPPLARIPMLEFASVLDIPGFEQAAQLHCMSVYDSDQPEIAALGPGQVTTVRFIQGLPLPLTTKPVAKADPAAWPPANVETRIMGQAPVEQDGSFFVNIAGNVPFYMELLDKQEQVLHTMRSWTWVRAGSQRGCIGCHEDRELAPQNRATDALIKMQPVAITAAATPQLLAAHR